MQELLDQVLYELKSALRFRWWGMLVIWAVCLTGWSWVTVQPNVYEASARVYVDTSSILQPVLGNQIIASNLDAQLAYVREALLGRAQLDTVAREIGLDTNATTAQRREAVIDGLRTDIRIVSDARARNSTDSIYSITYRNSDRGKAVGVVSAILDTFVENTLGANRQERDTAGQFLDARVDEYEARLGRAEQTLADFKKQNADKLPGTEGDYFQRMQSERDALALVSRQLRILQSKRDQLVAQLRGESLVVAGIGGVDVELPPNSIDARIRDAETRLDTMLLEYTERHPDVVALRERLERLLAQRAEQLAELGVDNTGQEIQSLSANPVYQALQVAIAETDVEMATLRADIAERTERVGELQGLIDEVPEVEAQLARLNRDYNVIYEQYLALVRSRETQDLTRKATETDQVDFRVINPPLAAFAPVAPNRIMLLGMVFAAALAVGGGICYALSQLAPVFSTGASLRRQVGLPVLGIVMHAWHERERARHRVGVGLFAATFAMLLAVFCGLVGVEMFGPGLSGLLS